MVELLQLQDNLQSNPPGVLNPDKLESFNPSPLFRQDKQSEVMAPPPNFTAFAATILGITTNSNNLNSFTVDAISQPEPSFIPQGKQGRTATVPIQAADLEGDVGAGLEDIKKIWVSGY